MKFSKNASKLIIGEAQNPQKGCVSAILTTSMYDRIAAPGKMMPSKVVYVQKHYRSCQEVLADPCIWHLPVRATAA